MKTVSNDRKNTAAASAVEPLDMADVRRRLRAIFIGSIGNLVEWYDFYAYAAFALYFAGSFFPGHDRRAVRVTDCRRRPVHAIAQGRTCRRWHKT